MTTRCMICGEEFKWIHTSHTMARHGITADEYYERFPSAPRVSEETSRKLSATSKGLVRSDKFRQDIAERMTGNTYTLGYKPSEATLQLLSESITTGLAARTPEEKQEQYRKHNESLKGNKFAQGHTMSEKSRRDMAETLRRLYQEGVTHTPETRRKISERLKELWSDPEFSGRVFEGLSRAMSKFSQGPNQSELQLQSILDKHFPGEWKYVGNGQVRIGGRNPDFVNVNSRKQVIEMFGIYWHDPDLFPNRPTEEELIAHYRKYGINCLVLWEWDAWDEVEATKKVEELNKEER